MREDEAVGMAAGAYMAGRIPAVLMQNSGLGTSLNTLIDDLLWPTNELTRAVAAVAQGDGTQDDLVRPGNGLPIER